jgi:catechol 2,3-dioxygenase-like lactoylglutathione lyase family enzyme
MQIAAVAVSATELSRAVAFYELLGFRFPAPEADTKHLKAEDRAGIRLMIDDAAFLAELHGEPPRPGNTAGFALLTESPVDVDAATSRVAAAGHVVVTGPYDAPWGQRYATVEDPDGYRIDLFCPLPG